MIITITGDPGSGKTTLAKKLAAALGLKYYYMGDLLRAKARERGITLRAYLQLGETDPRIDGEVDEYQKKLGETEDNFVIQGRTSHYLIPHAIHVFLSVELHEAARRIFSELQQENTRNEGAFSSEEEVYQDLVKRRSSDIVRYKKYFPGHDMFDPKYFDLWLDTTDLSIEGVFAAVMEFVRKKTTSGTQLG